MWNLIPEEDEMDKVREEDLLKQFDVTSREIDDDAVMVEDETVDDELVSPVYHGSHLKSNDK